MCLPCVSALCVCLVCLSCQSVSQSVWLSTQPSLLERLCAVNQYKSCHSSKGQLSFALLSFRSYQSYFAVCIARWNKLFASHLPFSSPSLHRKGVSSYVAWTSAPAEVSDCLFVCLIPPYKHFSACAFLSSLAMNVNEYEHRCRACLNALLPTPLLLAAAF